MDTQCLQCIIGTWRLCSSFSMQQCLVIVSHGPLNSDSSQSDPCQPGSCHLTVCADLVSIATQFTSGLVSMPVQFSAECSPHVSLAPVILLSTWIQYPYQSSIPQGLVPTSTYSSLETNTQCLLWPSTHVCLETLRVYYFCIHVCLATVKAYSQILIENSDL